MMWFDSLNDGDIIPVSPAIPEVFHGMVFRGTFEGGVLAEDPSPPAEGPAPTPDPKLVGVEFEGVMCSATSEDMWGLSSLRPHILAGASFPFYFSNGTVLLLTPDNVAAFEAVWIPFRASFFEVPA
ncbi:MAG: hypothetical protein RPU13_13810 [Candidatus Sedimenticola sp. (ex Thyasira tokunagai)]